VLLTGNAARHGCCNMVVLIFFFKWDHFLPTRLVVIIAWMSFCDKESLQDQGTPPPLPDGDSDREDETAKADTGMPTVPLDVPPLPPLQGSDALTAASGVVGPCDSTPGMATKLQAPSDGRYPVAPQPTYQKRKARHGGDAVAKRQKKGVTKNGSLVDKWQSVAKNLEEEEVSSTWPMLLCDARCLMS
jgi:hypothetical protein